MSGTATCPTSTRSSASDGHADPEPPDALSRDRALRDAACSTSATATASIGSCAAIPTASRSCSFTADPAADRAPTTGGSSTRTSTRSSSSTSAAAASRRPMRAWRPTRPGISSTTSRSCGLRSRRSTNGRCSAAAGARRSRSLMPRNIRSASPSSCCAASSCSTNMRSTGCTRRAARRRSIPTSSRSSSRRSPKDERGDLVEAYRKRLTSDDQDEQLAAAKAWSKWEGDIVTLLPSPETIEHFTSPEVAVAVARIENHYMANHGWLEEGQLLRGATSCAASRRHRPGAPRHLHAADRRVEAQAGVARGRAQHHPRRRASVQRAGRPRRPDPRDGQVRGVLSGASGGTYGEVGKHPAGLAVLAGTELAERFSYYGMTALLALYMVKQLLLPGHAENVIGLSACGALRVPRPDV